MQTTLNKIRKHKPCSDGWGKLLKHLGKTKADDEPLGITTILDSNGFEDALWCLRAVEGHDRELRLFAVWCARQVQHLMTDQRSLDALDVAERYANGQATDGELSVAWAAARAAARDSAWSAAGVAAWSAAGDAAWDAAGAAAWSAAWDAAWAAARAAAWAAAWAAARDSARAAAWDAARDSARNAAKKAQEIELRRICGDALW